MPDKITPTDGVEIDAAPSKSARKREMHALQELGESLVQLSDKQLDAIPVADEQLLEAIHDCRRINSNSARKRQLQFIGKLMRNIDVLPIAQAMDSLYQQQQTKTRAFHDLEELRDSMIKAGPRGAALALERYPNADRQKLRQLLLQIQRESGTGKPPAASRKLFRYLRELATAVEK